MKFRYVISALVLAVGILVGNLAQKKIEKLMQPSYNTEGIQLIEDRPPFVVTAEDFSPLGKLYPAAVSLHLETSKNNPDGFVCSATIISNTYALTAAHCLIDYKTGEMIEKINIKPLGDNATLIEGIPVGVNQRADYALIKGNFKDFLKLRVDVSPYTFFESNGNQVISCGYPWGDKPACYPVLAFGPCATSYCARTILYPGMSGGPVIDGNRGVVIAVNTAASMEYMVLSPLVGLFQTLGVEVQVEQ